MAGNLISQIPKYRRAENPPGMRFQHRDGEILLAIYEYDGVLSRRHLKEMFWPNKGWRSMERRLSKLFHNGYIDWPDEEQRRTEPGPKSIVWIGWRGILWLAAHQGVEVEPPKEEGERQLRMLERRLREKGVYWLRRPRWSKLTHDLSVVDFRLALERSVRELSFVNLEQWVCESDFRSKMDRVEYFIKAKDGRVERKERGVCPDGFFVIADREREARGEFHRLPCLLEVDMSTHDNPSFGRDKVAPYVAYVKSPAYRARFGFSTGVWLVVTRGERRMRNLMRQTEKTAGWDAQRFFFTCFADLTGNILTMPIWYKVGRAEPQAILQT